MSNGRLAHGFPIPGDIVEQAPYETVLDFRDTQGESIYVRAESLPSHIRSVMAGDLILGQHRRWMVTLADGQQIMDLCLSAILTLKKGGFEVLARDITGASLQ